MSCPSRLLTGLTQLLPSFNAFKIAFSKRVCLSLSVHLFLVECYPVLQSSGEDHLLHQVKRGERDTHMGRFPSALPTSASLISPLHEVCSSIAHDHHVVQSNVLARPLALLPSPLRSSSSSPRPQPCCLPARPAARPSGGEMSSFGPMPPSEQARLSHPPSLFALSILTFPDIYLHIQRWTEDRRDRLRSDTQNPW